MVYNEIVGVSVFWIGLIAAIILYANFRKFYWLAYIVSAALYMFTVTYIIESFNMGANGILITLAFSSVLMLGLGFYFKKQKDGTSQAS